MTTVNATQHNDPYPWVTIDEDGNPFRAHTAHEDGFDVEGNEWSGWEYKPRTDAELMQEG